MLHFSSDSRLGPSIGGNYTSAGRVTSLAPDFLRFPLTCLHVWDQKRQKDSLNLGIERRVSILGVPVSFIITQHKTSHVIDLGLEDWTIIDVSKSS